MGFDQVSLFLYPPRWKRHSVADTLMKHHTGQPVRIVSAVRSEDRPGPAVKFQKLCRWLEGRRFEVVNPDVNYGYFCSGRVESVTGHEVPEIEISTSTQGGEVTSLYCRFRLNRDAPLRAERWEAFVQELCESFHLQIAVSDITAVGPDALLTILRGDENWRYFAEQFGWPEPTE